MAEKKRFLVSPRILPPLDPDFKPAALCNMAFRKALAQSGKGIPVAIALEADGGTVSTFRTAVFPDSYPGAQGNLDYLERIVKFLLWMKGGWRVLVGGHAGLAGRLAAIYSKSGARAFDVNLMEEVYARQFVVEARAMSQMPADAVRSMPLGKHLDGCRIGFDLGASDRKVAAVIEGKSVFSEEVVWDPRGHEDPQYHFDEINAALKKAASFLPRVDAIGGSAAGIYVENSVRVASLFRGVPKDLFESRVRGLFLELRRAWNNIPFEVINDGEVTALAGSMSLGVNRVLGIAMGSSLAGGYVDKEGNLPGWLDELAFAPVDYDPAAPVDEWSGDAGCGVQYFTQQGVNRLAEKAGIPLDPKRTLAERLKDVQALMEKDDPRARAVFESVGVCFGYTVAHYLDFYDIGHLLMLGRVTSGKGGDLVLAAAQRVLREEFPAIAGQIRLAVPDEASRRVGQAIAAASLPQR